MDVAFSLLASFLALIAFLHLIVPPPCLRVRRRSPSCCHTKHLLSSSQYRRAVLLPPSLYILQRYSFAQHLLSKLYLPVAYPELVSRGVSKSLKCKWLVKVCASNGFIPLIKKSMAGGGFRATRTPPPLDTPLPSGSLLSVSIIFSVACSGLLLLLHLIAQSNTSTLSCIVTLSPFIALPLFTYFTCCRLHKVILTHLFDALFLQPLCVLSMVSAHPHITFIYHHTTTAMFTLSPSGIALSS